MLFNYQTILELYTPLDCFLGPVNGVSGGCGGERGDVRTNGQNKRKTERAAVADKKMSRTANQ